MENCICSFQSATGLTNAVDFSGISNILYDEIKINSNYNFLFGSNINSNLGYDILHYSNINYLYASNINSNLSNNIFFSSNINFLYTSNLYHLFNGNGIETSSNISNLYYNTGFIDSNLLWWRYELQGTQAELIVQKGQLTLLNTQYNILAGTVSANTFTLTSHAGRLDTLEPKVTNLENNTFTKEQTSNIFITYNVLDNTSNTLANYNNLYNRPIIFTQTETSNIFITSNVLSNTSNTLANYNNLYNRPDIFTQIETSNIFITSNHINTNFYNKTQSDNRYYTKTQSDSNYYTKTQSDNRYYTKTQSDSNYYTKTQSDNRYYTKTQLNDSLNTEKINIKISTLPSTFGDSFLNVSNSIVVRNTSPADNSTSVGYNDYNMNFGVGDADSFQIIPINGLGSVSQYNLPNLFIGNNYTGIKILKNDIMTFSSKTNLLFNANGTFEVYAARIGFVGEIFTDGHLLAKIPKYFTTSRKEVFNGVECLAYDLDLTTLTNKPTINGIQHRRFRITLTHSNGRLDFQFAPKVFQISLSTYNGLSAHCIGDLYGATQLDTVELGFCFFKNTIDKITFLGMTYLYGINPITVYYVIEDLFSA